MIMSRKRWTKQEARDMKHDTLSTINNPFSLGAITGRLKDLSRFLAFRLAQTNRDWMTLLVVNHSSFIPPSLEGWVSTSNNLPEHGKPRPYFPAKIITRDSSNQVREIISSFPSVRFVCELLASSRAGQPLLLPA
jgi:hypothetical protein